jgi:hypothetical protein
MATTQAPPPALVLGRLADEGRLRVVAAVALGDRSIADVAARAGLSQHETARAIAHLVGAGILVRDDSGLQVDLRTFARAARAASSPRKRPELLDATPEQRAVLRNFVDADGRITSLPARAGRRRLVLEYVAGRFEPEREYAEREVNAILAELHDDHATLRRLLVDEQLLTRTAGVYRRPGGLDP